MGDINTPIGTFLILIKDSTIMKTLAPQDATTSIPKIPRLILKYLDARTSFVLVEYTSNVMNRATPMPKKNTGKAHATVKQLIFQASFSALVGNIQFHAERCTPPYMADMTMAETGTRGCSRG